MAKHGFRDTQFAALPWRIGEGGRREVMLLTSRETQRWVIPKGWPMKGRKPSEAASREAYEEAGLIGHIVSKRPLGNFHYQKKLTKKERLCQVRVFSFRVERQLNDWPEKTQRETKWFDATESVIFATCLKQSMIALFLRLASINHLGRMTSILATRTCSKAIIMLRGSFN
jgi:8-oxo-dGTP pyrophosphatase MutT (NUDIX family)